jgi:transglutaminase-like putative cysteine protease
MAVPKTKKMPKTDFIATDQEKLKLIEQAGGTKDNDGADAVVVFDHTWVDVEKGGLGNTYNNRIVKILTDAGSAQNSALRFDYDPKANVAEVMEIVIHPKDGKKITLDLSKVRDLPQPESKIYWGGRMRVYSIPRLEVGDALEYTVYKKGFHVAYLAARDGETSGITPPMPGHFYDVVTFDEKTPIKHKRYTLRTPKDKPMQYEVCNSDMKVTATFDDTHFTYTWEKRNMPAFKPELRSKGNDVATKLVLATLGTWEEKSRWFYEVNEPQFAVDDAIMKKTKELIKDCKNIEEEFDVLLHWVAQEIRYVGFAVSKGEGYTLHSGTMTFRERAGVCKDCASMLITMGRAAGWKIYAAPTQAGGRVEKIPADQFDHCYCVVRKPNGEYMLLDPTWAVFSIERYCSAEQQQNYLPAIPQGDTLKKAPAVTAKVSLMTIDGTSALDAKGAVAGHIDVVGNGRADANLRRMCALTNKTNIRPIMEKIVESIRKPTSVSGFTHTDVTDHTKPTELHIDYEAARYGLAAKERIFFPVPMARFFNNPVLVRQTDAAATEKIATTIHMWYPQEITINERMTLPAGFKMTSRPVKEKIANDLASFEGSVTADGETVVLKATINWLAREITPEQYPQFKKVVDTLKKFSQRMYEGRKF